MTDIKSHKKYSHRKDYDKQNCHKIFHYNTISLIAGKILENTCFTHTSMPFLSQVFSRRERCYLLKLLCKIFRVIISAHLTDFIDFIFILLHKLYCMRNTYINKIIAEIFAGILLKQPR